MTEPEGEPVGPSRPGPSVGLVVGCVLLLVGAAVLVVAAVQAGHGSRSTPTTMIASPTTSSEPLPTVKGPFAPGRTPLPGFGEVLVQVQGADGEVSFCMLLALSEAQRQQGLMHVTDRTLGGYDGMVFHFDADTTGGFWMRNTPLPLTIAFLDATGRLVSSTDMAPCSDDPGCRNYQAAGRYRTAIEVPRGRFDRLGIDRRATVAVGGRCAAAG